MEKHSSDGAPSPSDEEKRIENATRTDDVGLADLDDPDEGKTDEERAKIVRASTQAFLR